MTIKYEIFTIRSLHKMMMAGKTVMLRGQFFGTNSKQLKKVEDIYITRLTQFAGCATNRALTNTPHEVIDRIISQVEQGKRDIYQHTELVLKFDGKQLIDVRVSTTPL